jgi:predicted DNA-binding protein
MSLHRTQLLLEHEQHEALSLLAQARGASISELVREMVQQGLERIAGQTLARLESLRRLGELRGEISERPLGAAESVLGELRDERAADLERGLRGEA